ncbi:MAG: hemolysin family protein [Desulfovibrionaceae bacterium]
MDDGSEGRFWSLLRGIFRRNDLEEHIRDAQDEGELEKEEVSMILSVLRLDETFVHEIMTPRPDMVCAEESMSLAELCELVLESGHSRLPIYRGNKDHIVGVLHAKDLLGPLLKPESHPDTLKDLVRPPYFVSESATVHSLLGTFKAGTHMAVALDEYGGTCGVVTLEDVLEEIVGEIQDEHDPLEEKEIRPTDTGAYIVSGRALLDDINEELGLSLDSNQVETIGGYLTELAGRVPEPGEHFSVDGRRFTVREADPRQVGSLIILPAKPAEQKSE